MFTGVRQHMWRTHASELQGMISDEKREKSMRQLLLTAVAQVGVPVNECAQRDWFAPMLQFVPGLGPRKAHSVVKVCSRFCRDIAVDTMASTWAPPHLPNCASYPSLGTQNISVENSQYTGLNPQADRC